MIQPLRAERHKGVGLIAEGRYGFARKVLFVPIGIGEFAIAQRWYPIVFIDNDGLMPVAVLGIEEGDNLYINDAGEWRRSAYIPTLINSHPFTASALSETGQRSLLVDEGSPNLVDLATHPDAIRLFDDGGQPLAPVQQAINLCVAIENGRQKTAAFVQELQSGNFLKDVDITITMPGAVQRIVGAKIIDERRIQGMSRYRMTEWCQKGWYSAATFQTASLLSMNMLAELYKERHNLVLPAGEKIQISVLDRPDTTPPEQMVPGQQASPQASANIRIDCGDFVARTARPDDIDESFIAWMSSDEVKAGLNLAELGMDVADFQNFLKIFDGRDRFFLLIEKADGSQTVGFFTVDLNRSHKTGLVTAGTRNDLDIKVPVLRAIGPRIAKYFFDFQNVDKLSSLILGSNAKMLANLNPNFNTDLIEEPSFRPEARLRDECLQTNGKRTDLIVFSAYRTPPKPLPKSARL